VTRAGTLTVWTVGHSSRSLEEVLDLLGPSNIRCLVDVRIYPRSQRHPQFDQRALRKAVEAAGIAYHWAGRALGGHRPPPSGSSHTALAAGLRGYADHMGSEAFQAGMTDLVDLAAHCPTAILCAEKDPQRCHRALIADYLVARGTKVVHLIAPDVTMEHRLSPQARIIDGQLVYNRATQGELALESLQ
jgi:uncharacterized protein (DUF488 family)